MRARRSAQIRAVAAAAAVLLAGCGGAPVLDDPDWTAVDFARESRSAVRGEIEVSVAVPGPEQTRALFGLPLADAGVQPVWLRIRNNERTPFWLVPVGTDPNYFSAHEVAWRFHAGQPPVDREEIDERLLRRQVPVVVPPGEAVSGFLYVHRVEGLIPINVDLVSEGDLRSFDFVMPVPGIVPDFRDTPFETLYESRDVVHLEDDEALRAWLAGLPCCAAARSGETEGDPLNFVLVGERSAIVSAFVRRGWNVTEATSAESIARLIDAYLSGDPYVHAPVSPLYLFGRRHDVALQKSRRTVHSRNHLRLWVAPARFRGQPVMVGQISRDVGIRYTGRLDPPTTHVIDPMVDEARYYVIQDLALSQTVSRIGYVAGARYAPPHAPARNLLGDPYYSDGLRGVLFLAETPTSIERIESLDWEMPVTVLAPAGRR